MGTLTTNLSLYKPANGETGWGDLVNTNVDLLDTAIPLKAPIAAPAFTGLVDISDATAGQVKFPATQNVSTNANTLDDYEEGTWTPTITFVTPGNLSVAYGNRTGRYIKIGRHVTLWFSLTTTTFTHTTAGGNLSITGDPFTGVNTTTISEGTLTFQGITKANYTQFTPEILNTAGFQVKASGSGQAQAAVTNNDMPTGGTVILRGTITLDAGV